MDTCLVRNTCWNLAGSLVPTLVAVCVMPPLILTLGSERFGVVAIGWVVMGYFVLSDLGLGRATTKYVSEARLRSDATAERDTVWTSLVSHLALGIVGGGVFAGITPVLVRHAFGIPLELQQETIAGFYWLAASIPVLLITSCLRGVLEAHHRFDLVNVLRVPMASINYLIPFLVLTASQDLSHILAAILVARIGTMVAHFICVIRVAHYLQAGIRFSTGVLGALFRFGGLLAISSLITPVILFADRIFIATISGAPSVTYYVTPYEVITKLWILSASLMGALFPALSVMRADSPEVAKLARRATSILLMLATPVVGILLAFGHDLLAVWITPEFAAHSGTVGKWLAVGVLVNIFAQVPLTVLQATGHPSVVARLQVIQLPAYICIAWWLSRKFGSVGVAMAWALRACVEAILLQFAAGRWTAWGGISLTRRPLLHGAIIALFLAMAWLVDTIWRFDLGPRLAVFSIGFTAYTVWQWLVFLNAADRLEIVGWIKRTLSRVALS